MGTAARDRGGVRRTANLRVTSFDYVFTGGLLLLCPAEKEISGGCVFPEQEVEGVAGEKGDAVVETQSGPPGSDHSPRPGGSPFDRLAQGSIRYFLSVGSRAKAP